MCTCTGKRTPGANRTRRTRAFEVFGPPSRLAEAESDARAAGYSTRRTGTSVSILGIDQANGDVPEGERRPANLEDVFVLLTGEQID